MALLLSILIFLAAILLIMVVLIQNPKGGGLASEFSSANQIGGVQETADFLEKATWTLAVGIMVLTLMRAGITGSGGAEEQEKKRNPIEEVMDEQMSRQNPVTPSQNPQGRGAPGQGKGSNGNGGGGIQKAIEQNKDKGEGQKSGEKN